MPAKFHIRVFNTTTQEWITNFSICDGGKVYACSELGDPATIEDVLKRTEYFDNVSFEDITNEVEIHIEKL